MLLMLALKTHLFFHYRAAWGREQQERGYSTKQSCLVCDIQKGKIKSGRFLYIAKKKCIKTTSTDMCDGCQAMQPCLECVQSTLAVMCWGFLTIQRYCCDDCYWCMAGVMKAKTCIGFGIARRNVSLGKLLDNICICEHKS